MALNDELVRLPLEERFSRGGGPGGQNVNKVETAVELRLNLTDAPLPEDVKARLVRLAGQRITADGGLVIAAREHRTQGQNREAARARLAALISRARKAPASRKPTKPGAAARERRLQNKQRRSALKRARSVRD